jgi:hypothetical protein
MSKYGIRFNSDPIETSDVAVPQTILARMNELKMQGCEIIIIYILNRVGDDIYHAIKYFGNIKIGKTYSHHQGYRIFREIETFPPMRVGAENRILHPCLACSLNCSLLIIKYFLK